MTIWRMHISWWIPKATRARARAHAHIYTHYVTIIIFPLQHRLHRGSSVLPDMCVHKMPVLFRFLAASTYFQLVNKS